MGAGFAEIRDGETMSGVVHRVREDVATDGDWCIHVKPDFATYLYNPKGYRNTNGLVECEIQPPDHVYDGRSKREIFQHYMNRLQGRRVVVAGTFVVDAAHAYDGESCRPTWYNPFTWGSWTCYDKGKTEIHPITSILATFSSNEVLPLPYQVSPGEQLAKRLELFVFSDCAGGVIRVIHQPPHSNESRTGIFNVPIGPVGLAGQQSSARYVVVSEVNRSRSRQFDIIQENGQWVFRGTVVSGTSNEGKGFYQGTVDLLFVGKKFGFSSPNFLPIEVGTSVTKTLELRNEGSVPLSLSVAPPQAGSQFQWTPFSKTLPAGEPWPVLITFQPTQVGPFTSVLTVTSDAPGSPHQISLTCRAYSSECPALLTQIEGVQAHIEELQEQLANASPTQKPTILMQIRDKQTFLAELEDRADTLGCR